MTLKTASERKRTGTLSLQRDPGLNGMFDIIVRANGVELNEQLREAAKKKIGRVRQYAPQAFRARVHVERDHPKAAIDQYRVMVRYEMPGHDIIAEHRAHEPMTALDLVAEKIERRLRKRKTARLKRRLGRQARARRIADFCGTQEHNPTERSN